MSNGIFYLLKEINLRYLKSPLHENKDIDFIIQKYIFISNSLSDIHITFRTPPIP